MSVDLIKQIATMAGEKILSVYDQENIAITTKSDHSPLTEADQLAHHLIITQLTQHYPGIPILSEENAETITFKQRRKWSRFWLVDPLDGTKEFINHNGQFTVNIALIEHQRPILGVIYAPTTATLYYAERGLGAYKEQNGSRKRLPQQTPPTETKRVVVSNSHLNQETENYIKELKSHYQSIEPIKIGSSLKFCLVAEGGADIYPRLGPTMEWDTAAAQIIVEEANGTVYHYQNKSPLIYNKPDLHNPWFIVNGGKP